ncbi:MAG: MmcQ/YjbR family DNA-binding protein [bacterium]|nr:MmcQ/YjbR family DNA-binding protein [bacterium]
MRLTTVQAILQNLPETVEEYPFGPEAMVFKVCGKMFACVSIDDKPLNMTIKVDPDDVEMLRDLHPSIREPRYFDKRHWNNIVLDGDIPRKEIERMVGESWRLVVAKLKKADRERLLPNG